MGGSIDLSFDLGSIGDVLTLGSLNQIGLSTTIIGAPALQYQATKEAQQAQENAAKERRKQIQLQKRQADIRAARERVQLLRQQRRAIAESQVVGTATGMAAGSAGQGAQASIQSQGASATSFLDINQELSQNIFQSGIREAGYAQDVAAAQGEAATWQAVGNIGSSIFSMAGGYPAIFGGVG